MPCRRGEPAKPSDTASPSGAPVPYPPRISLPATPVSSPMKLHIVARLVLLGLKLHQAMKAQGNPCYLQSPDNPESEIGPITAFLVHQRKCHPR